MFKNISPVQTIPELQFVESSHSGTYFVPLNLDTFLYCCVHKKKFLNPINYLDSSFHVNALKESKKFTDSLPVFSEFLSIQSEIVAWLRYYFHQIYYLEYLLLQICGQEKIEFIYVSGWDIISSIDSIEGSYTTSRIVRRLFGKKVRPVEVIFQKASSLVLDYEVKKTKFSQVLINGYGYNFKRLDKACKRKNTPTTAIVFGNLTGRHRISSWLRDYKYAPCDTKRYSNSDDLAEPDSVILANKLRENLINERLAEITPYLLTQLNKCRLIDRLLENNRFLLVASCVMRGISGYLLEKSHEINIPSIGISHGTISPAFDDTEKIYKNIIAEAVFSGNCTHVALQSKITKDALKTQTVRGDPILTGNLIFAEEPQKTGKYILYAVTLKDFYCIQYLGVEMYYEFVTNLNSMVALQEIVDLPIVVQLHPTGRSSKDKLKKLFPMLTFSTKNISTCLKNSLLTISYSSTVIEDSLYCNVPVILFDQWKRYQHCHAETDPSTENKAVYYVTDMERLITAIHTVISSQNIQFSEYTVPGKSSINFDSLIKDFI